ncbi:bifunctional riboflavin kinase/FAD synthetase [Pannus brasiliensis CCIBt3594]|uniref:Riboflavin biosynthesis protein n=1 Tax=Pannus brasiliensis CCIBt3594 TaxID=1427578 RepID=A0AAW9QL48_9CHRO
MWIVDSPTTPILVPCAIALGNFDGIHSGHQTVLAPILNARRECDAYPTVVTFTPHPREFFTGEKRALLTPVAEKIEILEKLGIEQLVLLPFTAEMAALSPAEFVDRIIVEKLQAKSISVGEDFHFGHRRAGSATDLATLSERFGIRTRIVPLKNCRDCSIDPSARVSSSLIRQALAGGDVERARQMLGRPYRLIGRVVRGQQLGRTLGFPTANLELPGDKLLPRFGVYSARVSIDSEEPIAAVMNIGCRPTVDGSGVTVEVHLLDWSGELVDRTLSISLVSFLRPEQKFNSLDELKNQIARDCLRARESLAIDRGNGIFE